jgi:hypothetical protein
MSKYKVKLVSEITKVAFVGVEADNETEAVEEAYEYEEKDLEWEYTHTEYWADDVEKLKEEENGS